MVAVFTENAAFFSATFTEKTATNENQQAAESDNFQLSWCFATLN